MVRTTTSQLQSFFKLHSYPNPCSSQGFHHHFHNNQYPKIQDFPQFPASRICGSILRASTLTENRRHPWSRSSAHFDQSLFLEFLASLQALNLILRLITKDFTKTSFSTPAVAQGSSSRQHPGFKLKVDATFNSKLLKFGFGASIVNGRNQRIAGLSSCTWGASTPIFAEAQALFTALEWCSTIRIPFSTIESDCLQLVSKIRSSWKDNSAFSSLVHQIRESLSFFPNATLQHIPRSQNQDAHLNARKALSINE
ncbi:hypothetical protein G4B88_003560 [Cannabis sativa]|uniref:RNase H type-1 domain-containing protein n=1 Tax=Cannabis sativa TaxID=3483 RepID=A0A7J6EPJ6_CANSA|nr:hypothetical protein G4B88_003560 [Cannabis sativa]